MLSETYYISCIYCCLYTVVAKLFLLTLSLQCPEVKLNIISTLESVSEGICDLDVVYVSGIVTMEHH